MQDVEWTVDVLERPPKKARTSTTLGEEALKKGRGERKSNGKCQRNHADCKDEIIAHPALATVFKACERAAVDFCADQEASSSGKQVRRVGVWGYLCVGRECLPRVLWPKQADMIK